VQVNNAETGKSCATVDIEKVSRAGRSEQMPESWLEIIRGAVRDAIDQRVTQAVHSAVSEAAKTSPYPENLCVTPSTLPESGKCVKKDSELLEEYIPSPDLSSFLLSSFPSQRECKSVQLSDATPGVIADHSPWPTRPSVIYRSISHAKSSAPQQGRSNFHRDHVPSAVESKPNQNEEKKTDVSQGMTDEGHELLSQCEEVRWSLVSMYGDAVQKQTLGGDELKANNVA